MPTNKYTGNFLNEITSNYISYEIEKKYLMSLLNDQSYDYLKFPNKSDHHFMLCLQPE